jgi:hypothetical protein
MGLLIDGVKTGKSYINNVKHNAYLNGVKVFSEEPPLSEVFAFTVQDGGSFNIPVSGVNGGSSSYQSYSWKIDWGDGTTPETATGTSSAAATIPHTYADGGVTHQIKIYPNGKPSQGWFNAFGSGDMQPSSNVAKIKTIDTPVITSFMRTMGGYAYYYMFRGCTGLTSIPADLLSATTLATYCYAYMFQSCTGLTAIPADLLPATTLTTSCYQNMFRGCRGLTSLPAGLLPATSVASSCYGNMFQSCTGLTSLPTGLLPATSLKTECYYAMFRGCRGLTSLPAGLLPATTLLAYCYYSMFADCTNLTDIGTIDAAWFAARTPTQGGMFRNAPAITTPIAYADIPEAWK